MLMSHDVSMLDKVLMLSATEKDQLLSEIQNVAEDYLGLLGMKYYRNILGGTPRQKIYAELCSIEKAEEEVEAFSASHVQLTRMKNPNQGSGKNNPFQTLLCNYFTRDKSSYYNFRIL
ncbi:hypothetical protein QYF36_000160 [Acer negundo]|nr:hypothetical protein QYF36_000160 [Acer negundo]